jgi:hypothetical protein
MGGMVMVDEVGANETAPPRYQQGPRCEKKRHIIVLEAWMCLNECRIEYCMDCVDCEDPSECTCDIRVWFDTGFWYNEGNHSIRDFGGEEEGIIDVGCVKWGNPEEVQCKLEAQGIRSDISKRFPHSLQGTESLYAFLKEQGYPKKDMFGILVWHQLGYNAPLMGCWESGQCGSPVCWYRE